MPRPLYLVPAVLFACGPTGPTYHSDIEPLVSARCINCHIEGGIAPFSMKTYAQVKVQAAAMLADVQAGLMPPWKAAPSADVQYLRNPQLTPEQIATLKTWIDHGMPEGDPGAKKNVVDPIGGGIDRVDLKLKMPVAYTPQLVPDDYRCFPIRWPEEATKYITGFNATPGYGPEVHHIAMFAVPPAQADVPFQWDDAEAGPGYTCFGGPYPAGHMDFPTQVLNAWIPGYDGVAFPRGLGEKMEPGSTVVLQMHYNLSSIAAMPDQTELQFKLDDTVEHNAAYQPFLNVAWVAGGMPIPAGNPNVVHEYKADPRDFFKFLGSPLDNTNGFNIEGVMFHMHKLGVDEQLFLDRADGTSLEVLHIPAWDFHWQMEYYLSEPVRFNSGDQLRVRCQFDNSQAKNPDMKDVNWGEGSGDEMCVANIYSSQAQ